MTPECMVETIGRTLIIIPTYNEAENIPGLLKDLLARYPTIELLIVDDRSPDGTGSIVRQYQRTESRVHLLEREKKDGLAAAYIAGFAWALERKYDWILQMDADFSHNPKDVARLQQALETYDVAVGCRYMDGGNTIDWSLFRRMISRGGNYFAKTLLNLPLHDMTGGFNGWRREVLASVDLASIRSQGYAFQVELKYRAERRGFSIEEIPIHFADRRFGKSKMSGGIIWEAAFRVFQMRLGGVTEP